LNSKKKRTRGRKLKPGKKGTAFPGSRRRVKSNKGRGRGVQADACPRGRGAGGEVIKGWTENANKIACEKGGKKHCVQCRIPKKKDHTLRWSRRASGGSEGVLVQAGEKKLSGGSKKIKRKIISKKTTFKCCWGKHATNRADPLVTEKMGKGMAWGGGDCYNRVEGKEGRGEKGKLN